MRGYLRSMSRFGPAWWNAIRARIGGRAARAFAQSALNVRHVNALETEIKKLTDAELRKASLDLRWRIKGGETLEKVMPRAFAIVREAAQRTVGLRHHDVQLLGGTAMTRRALIEMEPGEGKTLVATLPVYLYALAGQGVHVMTVNDYLAQRDAELMSPVYNLLGMRVGVTNPDFDKNTRRAAYQCDITYGTATQFGFDFLQDRLAMGGEATASGAADLLFGEKGKTETPMQRGHYCAIIDEADSVLIDDARTPLIISAPSSEPEQQVVDTYEWAARHAGEFQDREDFTRDPEKKTIELKREGRWKVRALPMSNLVRQMPLEELYEYIERAIKVLIEFQCDQQYVVMDGEIQLVDEGTGRIMHGRKLRGGLHQAIEAKERVAVTVGTSQAARTTIQNYFLRYKNLLGMTGTIWSSRWEVRRIYNLTALKIPTHYPSKRKRLPDQMFTQAEARWQAVVNEARKLHEQRRPVLIGTRSIDASEHISKLLNENGVPHTILNAKEHAKEAEIVSKAGELGAVTIATNMAGRGTDIKVSKEVDAMGGLHVIGTERHDSERVDNQLIGRSGRHGAPGSSQFFLSLDDQLLEGYGTAKARRIRESYRSAASNGGVQKDRLVKLLRKAQRRIERKHSRGRTQMMKFEKRRTEMQENMGLDPFLNTAE